MIKINKTRRAKTNFNEEYISSFNIIEILIVFILSYIFEYGCLLQTKSKEKIYENIN